MWISVVEIIGHGDNFDSIYKSICICTRSGSESDIQLLTFFFVEVDTELFDYLTNLKIIISSKGRTEVAKKSVAITDFDREKSFRSVEVPVRRWIKVKANVFLVGCEGK